MPTPLIRYGLDPTGVSPDNYVQDEHVVLQNRRIRAVAPKEGAFYGASLVVREDSTGRTLTPGVHYSPAEYLRTASEMVGKRVYTIFLINDPAVSSNLSFDYQAIGGEFTGQSETLKQLLEQHRHDGTEYSYYDVVGLPDAFNPTPHFHTLEDGMQFQYMTHALERIRNAILWADSPAIQDIYTYIETLLADLDEKLKHKVDSILSPLLYEFRRTINKATIGLDKLENLRVATQAEGTKAGLQETKIQDFLERKYIALDTIVAFKDSLYNALVSKDTTNLGRTAATFIEPKKQNLFALPNGSVVTFLSKREALAGNGFDQSCYPSGINDDTRLTVHKITNNRNNRGGIFVAYTMDGTKSYLGQHSSGNVTEDISWRRYLFTEDLKVFTDLLSAHIQNTNNPHKVRKDQVGLSEVENLPVITREEILCLKSVRKYMTFDAFLLFMKAFMIGKNGSAADPGDESGEPLENCQIIYCPCSPCGCGPSSSTPPPSYPPAGQEISWSCRGFDKWGTYHNGSGGTYDQIIATNAVECGWTPPATPPPADQELGWFCEGTNKIGKYSDGRGGVYNNLKEANSPDCGVAPPGPTPVPTPPAGGDPYLTVTFASSSVRVGNANAVPVSAVAKNLTAGKKYRIEYKLKFENQAGYQGMGVMGGEFTASSSERINNESFLNEGNAYPGRLAVIGVLTDIATGRTYDSPVAYVTLVIDKSIELSINGIKTGGDLPAGQSVTVSMAFKDWPIAPHASSWAIYIYDNAGAYNAITMDSLGTGNITQAVTPVDANFRGAVKYKIVGRWAVPSQAGGGTRELSSNVVTINWTGPGEVNFPAGHEFARECNGPNLVGTYANGTGGIYTQVIAYNSPVCVSAPPPNPTPSPSPSPGQPPPPPAGETIQRAINYTISMRGAGSSYQGQIQAVWSTANSAETVTISGVQAAIRALTNTGNASVGGGQVRSFQQNFFAGQQSWDSEPLVYYFVPRAAFMASDFELYFEGDYYGSQP